MPMLAVIGIDWDGKREILGFPTGDRDNQQAWEDVLENLTERGVKTIDLWITDGGKAMRNAIENKCPTAKRQRCIRHNMENVLASIPTSQHAQVSPDLRAIFSPANREKAEQTAAACFAKYDKSYPTATDCLQRDLDVCLTCYQFPASHWRYIRTSNAIERLFQEVKKRSHKMAAAFRNENRCLLLFYAVIRSVKFRRISMPATATAQPEILHNS